MLDSSNHNHHHQPQQPSRQLQSSSSSSTNNNRRCRTEQIVTYSITTVPCQLRSPSPFIPLPPSSIPVKSRTTSKGTEAEGLGERASQTESSPSPNPIHRAQTDSFSSSPRLVQVGTDGRSFQFVHRDQEGGGHGANDMVHPKEWHHSQNHYPSSPKSNRSSLVELDSGTSCKAYPAFGSNSRRFLDDSRSLQDPSSTLLEAATEPIRSEAAKRGLPQALEEEEQRIFVFDDFGKLQQKSRAGSRSSTRSQANSDDKSLKLLKTMQHNSSEEAILLSTPLEKATVFKSPRSHSPRIKTERRDTAKPKRVAISRAELQNWVDGVKGESADPNPELSLCEGPGVDSNNLEEALLEVDSSLRELSMVPSSEYPVDAEPLNEAHLSAQNQEEDEEESPIYQPVSRASRSSLSLADSNFHSTAPTTATSGSGLESNPRDPESWELSERKTKIMSQHINSSREIRSPLNRSNSASDSSLSSSPHRSSSREAIESLPPSLIQTSGSNVKVSDFKSPLVTGNTSSLASSSSNVRQEGSDIQQVQTEGKTDLEMKAELLDQFK